MPRKTTATLDGVLKVLLPDIDESLASHGAPLPERPYRAAMFIVEHCIVEIEGESKDKYHTKPWFSVLLSATIDWYGEYYGDAMSVRSTQSHTAVVLVRKTPIALEVPLALSSPVAEDNTFWITLAASVLPGENPLDWLVHPPNLSKLSEQELLQVKTSAALTAELVRRISNGLMTVEKKNKRALQHAALVLTHLQSASQSILQPGRHSFSTAIWELNFATENAIKCHLWRTQVTKVPNVHDVRQLDSLAMRSLQSVELAEALAAMPSGAQAVQYRYGEMGDVPLSLALKVHQASLVICRYYANAIPPQRFRLENASFQMKLPPRVVIDRESAEPES